MGVMARPTIYSEDLADTICARLSAGESLLKICEDDGIPSRTTIYQWVATNQAFADKYAHARNVGLDDMADDLIRLSDDDERDVQRLRLRVDTRKWYLSKLAPKRYGERIEHVGADGKDLIPQSSPEEVARKIAFLLAQGMK